MKKVTRPKISPVLKTEVYEGESIETKVRRIVDNKEPISDGAPIIFTEKKDGVLPQYDIRTDKWDMAVMAMDAVNRAKIARSNGTWNPDERTKTEKKAEGDDADGKKLETGDTKGASEKN